MEEEGSTFDLPGTKRERREMLIKLCVFGVSVIAVYKNETERASGKPLLIV